MDLTVNVLFSLQKFRGATMGPGTGDDVLKDIIMIDTPGTLDSSGWSNTPV